MTAFYLQTDPTRAFITGLQMFLRVSPTGIWDPSTHDALRVFLKQKRASIEIGAWGQDSSAVTSQVRNLLDARDDAEFQRIRGLLGYLGLPNSSFAVYQQYQRSSEAFTALDASESIVDAIRSAEGTFSVQAVKAQKASLVVMAAGVAGIALFLTILYTVLKRR